MSWDAQQISRQGIGGFADQGADKPVIAAAALGVTRTDNKIIILQKLFYDREVFGVMGKVGVHGDELLVLMVDGIFHCHQMSRPQAQLGRAVNHMDSRVCGREPVQKSTRSVRRVVVDYEDFRIRKMLENFIENIFGVVRFVIGSSKNQSFWHGFTTVWRQEKV